MIRILEERVRYLTVPADLLEVMFDLWAARNHPPQDDLDTETVDVEVTSSSSATPDSPALLAVTTPDSPASPQGTVESPSLGDSPK